MTPIQFLGLLIFITLAARLIYRVVRRRHRNELRRLAAQWQMRYAERDLFHLASRINKDFPVPGATGLRVFDLIYASGDAQHRYLFTVEYTTGPAGHRRREARAATLCDPHEDALAKCPTPLRLATPDQPLADQYLELRQTL